MWAFIEFLIVLSIILLLIEIIISTGGILAFSGIVSFFFAFAIMFIWKVKIPFLFLTVTVPAFVALLILSIIVIILAYKAQKKKPLIGDVSLIGQTGVCVKDIKKSKKGLVEINGELWTAYSDEEIEKGQKVIVEKQESLKLKVRKEV